MSSVKALVFRASFPNVMDGGRSERILTYTQRMLLVPEQPFQLKGVLTGMGRLCKGDKPGFLALRAETWAGAVSASIRKKAEEWQRLVRVTSRPPG